MIDMIGTVVYQITGRRNAELLVVLFLAMPHRDFKTLSYCKNGKDRSVVKSVNV